MFEASVDGKPMITKNGDNIRSQQAPQVDLLQKFPTSTSNRKAQKQKLHPRSATRGESKRVKIFVAFQQSQGGIHSLQ